MPKFEGTSIRIAALPQLGAENDILDGFEFENCEIIGPAVLAVVDNVTIAFNTFDGDFEAMLWEIPMTRQRVIGAIGLRNCSFVRCTFRRIGFAGPAAFITQFRKGTSGVTQSPPTPAGQTGPVTL